MTRAGRKSRIGKAEGQLSLLSEEAIHTDPRAARMGSVELRLWGVSGEGEREARWRQGLYVTPDGGAERVGLIGLDEAGRGPLAGPVSVAAVALPPRYFGPDRPAWFDVVDDSKKLTARRREALFEVLVADDAIAWSIVHVSADRIDRVNILQATLMGMSIAVELLLGIGDQEAGWDRLGGVARHGEGAERIEPLFYSFERDDPPLGVDAIVHSPLEARSGSEGDRAPLLLIDGNTPIRTPGSIAARLARELIKKGDALSVHIAAASVLAKVSRDAVMKRADGLWEGYGFAGHKGYPTKAHRAAIDALGRCPIHRRSFGKRVDKGSVVR